jgi:ComF family protein
MIVPIVRLPGLLIKHLLITNSCILCKQSLEDSGGFCRFCQRYLASFRMPPGCLKCGHPLANGSDSVVCGPCQQTRTFWDQLHIGFHYADVVQYLLIKYKYHQNLNAGKFLISVFQQTGAFGEIAEPPQVVTSVPLPWQRYLKRGFNQSALFAWTLARDYNIQHREDLLARKRNTRPQSQLTRNKRQKLSSDDFTIHYDKISPYTHIGIVDDVISTASTLQAIINAIKMFHSTVTISVFCLAKNI